MTDRLNTIVEIVGKPYQGFCSNHRELTTVVDITIQGVAARAPVCEQCITGWGEKLASGKLSRRKTDTDDG